MSQTQRLALACLAAAIAVACGKDDAGSKSDDSAGKAAPDTGKSGDADKPPPEAEEKSGLELFSGSAVALPGPIARLAFKMPVDEAARLAPNLVGDAKKYGPLEGFARAKAIISLTADKSHLRSFVFTIENPLDELTAHLEKMWGKPVEATKAGGGVKRYWTNAAEGLRMYAESHGGGGSRVVFEQTVSFDDFVGAEEGRFGFERLPLLGADVEEVKKAYAKELIGVPQKKEDRLSIPLPAPEFTEYPVFLSLKIDKGKVAEWQFSVSYSLDESARDKMLAALEAKFGKGKKGKMYIDYKGPPKVKVDHTGEQHTVWVK